MCFVAWLAEWLRPSCEQQLKRIKILFSTRWAIGRLCLIFHSTEEIIINEENDLGFERSSKKYRFCTRKCPSDKRRHSQSPFLYWRAWKPVDAVKPNPNPREMLFVRVNLLIFMRTWIKLSFPLPCVQFKLSHWKSKKRKERKRENTLLCNIIQLTGYTFMQILYLLSFEK